MGTEIMCRYITAKSISRHSLIYHGRQGGFVGSKTVFFNVQMQYSAGISKAPFFSEYGGICGMFVDRMFL